MIGTFVTAVTPKVVTGNVTDVAPDGTVTKAGTEAAELLVLDRLIEVEVVGAGVTTIVAVELVPPEIEEGEKIKLTMPPGGRP